jgi:hypothetical protein
MTWRKLGFAIYSDSLAYREVLNQNPAWDVTELPAPGTVLRKSPSSASGAGASQQPSIFSQVAGQASLSYYPFTSQNEYYASLFKYTSLSLKEVDRNNGWTSDSYPVVTGIQ